MPHHASSHTSESNERDVRFPHPPSQPPAPLDINRRRSSAQPVAIGTVDPHGHGREDYRFVGEGRQDRMGGVSGLGTVHGWERDEEVGSYYQNPSKGIEGSVGVRHHHHHHHHSGAGAGAGGERRQQPISTTPISEINSQRGGFPLSPLSPNTQYQSPHSHRHSFRVENGQQPQRAISPSHGNSQGGFPLSPLHSNARIRGLSHSHRVYQPSMSSTSYRGGTRQQPPTPTLYPLLHPSAHVYSPPNHQPSHPMSMPSPGMYLNQGIPSQVFGPAAGLQPGMGPGIPQTYLPNPPLDYTTFSALTGNNLETMPFSSPHFPGPGGVGYPNAMPLCRSAEVLPGVGSYGHPRHPTFCKPDYRRFCFSVGKADVPYAAVGQVAPALGMGGPFA